MIFLNTLFKEIETLAQLEPKSLTEMALKLSEETGEVAQAILSLTNASGSNYKELSTQDVQEECIDVILVATALFYKTKPTTQTELIELLQEKSRKWKKHMDLKS